MAKVVKNLIYIIVFTYIQYEVCGRNLDFRDHRNASITNKLMVDMINSCFTNYQYIIFDAAQENDLSEFLWSLRPINIMINMDYKRNKSEIENFLIKKVTKRVDSFFLILNSDEWSYGQKNYSIITGIEKSLNQTLKSLKHSRYWSSITPIFITLWSPNGCIIMKKVFEAAWKTPYSLTTYFLCLDKSENPLLYTYHLYTNRVPATWEIVENRMSNHWILLKQLQNENNLCKGLNFDRTEYLDGREIQFSAENYEIRTPQNGDKFIESFKNALQSSLNVTLINCTISHIQKDIQFTLQDYDHQSFYFPIWYPIICTGDYVLTYPSTRLSITEKISNFYGMLSIITTSIILSITFFIILLKVKRNKIVYAVLQVLRLLLNKSLHIKINTLSLQIFFFMIFLYILIIQSTLNGNLAQLFITPEFYDVDSLDDLIAHKKNDAIYVNRKNSHNSLEMLKNVNISNLIPCSTKCINDTLSRISNDHNLVLIDDYIFAVNHAVKHNLHLSKKPIGLMRPLYFYTRKGFLLVEKICYVFMRLHHSGLIEKWKAELVPGKLRYQQMIKERLKVEYSPINIGILMFAFQFLAFGYICALVCFIIEKLTKSLQNLCKDTQ